MKSDNQIMNELAKKSDLLHVLTEEESKRLKLMLLLIYKDIARLCEQHSITFMLGGGSCLGAVRHKGFIPWDDDLDLMMFRKDYEELLKLCKAGALGENYEVDAPSRDCDSKNLHLKIYRKGTLDNELLNENTCFPKGIFIDVFPMDSTSKNKIIRNVHGAISNVLQLICTSVLYSEYPSSKYKEFVKQSEDALHRYKLRIIIGKIFGIIPHKKWVWWFDRFNCSVKDTGYITIPTGRNHYVGETQRYDVFFPVKHAVFEGMDVPVCANCDRYLTSLYGDYMKIPPVEKRERHFVYQFRCDL